MIISNEKKNVSPLVDNISNFDSNINEEKQIINQCQHQHLHQHNYKWLMVLL